MFYVNCKNAFLIKIRKLVKFYCKMHAINYKIYLGLFGKYKNEIFEMEALI